MNNPQATEAKGIHKLFAILCLAVIFSCIGGAIDLVWWKLIGHRRNPQIP